MLRRASKPLCAAQKKWVLRHAAAAQIGDWFSEPLYLEHRWALYNCSICSTGHSKMRTVRLVVHETLCGEIKSNPPKQTKLRGVS